MNKEEIKDEFVSEIEKLLSYKKQVIDNLSGQSQTIAKYNHLEEFNAFAGYMNERINILFEKYNIKFKNDKELKEYIDFLNPTFQDFYKQYAAIGALK